MVCEATPTRRVARAVAGSWGPRTRPDHPGMAAYVMLAALTPEGVRTVNDNPIPIDEFIDSL